MNRLAIFPVLLLPLLAAAQQKGTDNLKAYIDCQFGEKYQIEESVERAQPFMRPVDTMDGKNTVEVVHGWSLHIAYDGTPFVNFKAERLGKSNYLRDKQTLISSLEHAASQTEGMESNKPQQSALNSFEVYSINRKQLEGGVLSIYFLFQDSEQTVVTLYLLNTPPEAPKFKTIGEYHTLRENFLNSYTSCASKHLK
jgi:hypothetical protein